MYNLRIMLTKTSSMAMTALLAVFAVAALGPGVARAQAPASDPSIEEVIRRFSEKEKELLRWICSEMTYKDIAGKMFVSPRTLDDYRNNLFEKLKVKTRVGLVLYAIRNRLVEV